MAGVRTPYLMQNALENPHFSLDLYSNLRHLKIDDNQKEGRNNEVRGDD